MAEVMVELVEGGCAVEEVLEDTSELTEDDLHTISY